MVGGAGDELGRERYSDPAGEGNDLCGDGNEPRVLIDLQITRFRLSTAFVWARGARFNPPVSHKIQKDLAFL